MMVRQVGGSCTLQIVSNVCVLYRAKYMIILCLTFLFVFNIGIIGRWVDREIGWKYPDNAHLTQSLWRASRYMGCGESVKDWGKGKCRVQVCRYVKAGNCGMATYNATDQENWLVPMLLDTSRCEPSCPPEGCY